MFIEGPPGSGWFVTFFPGNDTQFVFALRGWEFDEGDSLGHPCVDDPCDMYRAEYARAQDLAETFGWPYFDAGSSVVLLQEGQVLVTGSKPADDEPPELVEFELNADPALRDAA